MENLIKTKRYKKNSFKPTRIISYNYPFHLIGVFYNLTPFFLIGFVDRILNFIGHHNKGYSLFRQNINFIDNLIIKIVKKIHVIKIN